MQSHPSLLELTAFAESIRTQFAAPIDLPEPGFRLALSERAGQPARQFKHLHQMCLLHVQHLAISGKIKLLALLDGYLSSSNSGAVIGQYLFARTILEQCAFMNEVLRRLIEVGKKPASSWMPKGEEFFALAVRFRFATGDKEFQKTLESHGYPAKLLKPVNVMNCVASLLSNPKLEHLAPFYDKLCDFVHHNGPSHFTTSSGYYVGSVASRHDSGGAFVMNGTGPISRYEYPTPTKAMKAIDETISEVLLAAKACLQLIEELPDSPFPRTQVVEMTGTESGMVYLGQAIKNAPMQ